MGDHFNWWSLISTLIAGLAIFWVQRQAIAADKERERLDSRMKDMESRMHALEIKVISEIPNREDYKDLNRRYESLESTVHEIRDIVLRMEAIAKAK